MKAKLPSSLVYLLAFLAGTVVGVLLADPSNPDNSYR